MTDRKVLNKYYPPDYDPTKIPRIKKADRVKCFNIRTMAPFNMRCNTCNGYIYKARKFNSKMETADDIEYLGLRHYRFFIRCSTCCAEIVWRTDVEKQDYVIESGAKRSFEALRTAEELESKKAEEEAEELANNPMKLMEKRTEQSKREMEVSEMLEDIREMNKRQHAIENDHLALKKFWQLKESEAKKEQDEEDKFIKSCFEKKVDEKMTDSSKVSNMSCYDSEPIEKPDLHNSNVISAPVISAASIVRPDITSGNRKLPPRMFTKSNTSLKGGMGNSWIKMGIKRSSTCAEEPSSSKMSNPLSLVYSDDSSDTSN